MTYIGNHTKNNKFKLYSIFITKGVVRRLHTGTTNQLGYYLAGLIEGDGSILVRKGKRESIAPKIVFTFGKNEIPMCEKLK